MSTNKHACLRYLIINDCLRDQSKAWNWRSLSEEIERRFRENHKLDIDGPKERQVKADIAFMRENRFFGSGTQIIFDRAEKTYKYIHDTMWHYKSTLEDIEETDLSNLISAILHNPGLAKIKSFEILLNRLKLMVHASKDSPKNIVQIENPDNITGLIWFDAIYEAIKHEQNLTITYQPYNRDPYSLLVRPYLLKEFQNRWYLIAYNHKLKSLRTYGIDRIQDVKPSFNEKPYYSDSDFEPNSYFNNIIGITNDANENVETIKLKVYGWQVDYLRSKKLHWSQSESKKTAGYSIFTIEVKPNREFEIAVLGLGETIEVLEPEYVRKKIKERIASALGRYL